MCKRKVIWLHVFGNWVVIADAAAFFWATAILWKMTFGMGWVIGVASIILWPFTIAIGPWYTLVASGDWLPVTLDYGAPLAFTTLAGIIASLSDWQTPYSAELPEESVIPAEVFHPLPPPDHAFIEIPGEFDMPGRPTTSPLNLGPIDPNNLATCSSHDSSLSGSSSAGFLPTKKFDSIGLCGPVEWRRPDEEPPMSAITLTDELRAQLALNGERTELRDADGKTVAVVLSDEEYRRLLYDAAHAIFSTPEAEAQAERSLEQIRQGQYVTSAQLFEELRRRGYMSREPS